MKKNDKNIKAEESHKAILQGQQQGGNHGGGGSKGGNFGNQTKVNSVRTQQQDQDGDTQGRKGKK